MDTKTNTNTDPAIYQHIWREEKESVIDLYERIDDMIKEREVLKKDIVSLKDKCSSYEKTIDQIDQGYNKNCDLINNLTEEVRDLHDENMVLRMKYHLDTIKWRTCLFLLILTMISLSICYYLPVQEWVNFDDVFDGVVRWFLTYFS